ncbi:glycosyltransferase family 2 protein [Blautia sp. HCP3S3_G3]|uniref:glycosyltransferase family 2 protein n=1 Tax=Blautia sp. HCP3S3_G3 TaxID=3438913 RepID=UPI003F8A901E
MKNVDFVFVLLTYRNFVDLQEFIESAKSQKINAAYIVVDAFYDNESSEKIKAVAEMAQADYLSVPNKGYSYGNNYGIKFAKKNYDFKFLIVSNPDIVLKQFSIDHLEGMEDKVIGPKIINRRNQLQNPMFVSENLLAQRFVYKGLKNHNKLYFYSGIALNKIRRAIFLKSHGESISSVYQLHGSFVIFGRLALNRIEKVYDENMFLFAEESYLAIKLKIEGICSIYNPHIIVNHKEDGSMGFRNDISNQLKEANIYVFEKYYGFKD